MLTRITPSTLLQNDAYYSSVYTCTIFLDINDMGTRGIEVEKNSINTIAALKSMGLMEDSQFITQGLLRNKNTVVTSNINREAVQKVESRQVLERSFDGSLPKFVAAFLGGEKITPEEAEEIKKMLDEYRGNT